MSVKNVLLLIALSAAALGCAATAKDPYSANTAEILFGDNVQRYLDGRRLTLQNLKNRVAELDDEILSTLGHLHSLERDLEAAEQRTGASDRELAALQAEVRMQKASAEASFERTNELKAKRDAMEADVAAAQQNQAEDETQIESLQQEVTRLEGDVVVLNRAIERNVNLKAEQFLSGSATR